ncbi:MAG: class D sortase [Clostridia bacterium]
MEHDNKKGKHSHFSKKAMYLVPIVLLVCAVTLIGIACSRYIEIMGTFYSVLVNENGGTSIALSPGTTFRPYVPSSSPVQSPDSNGYLDVITRNELPSYPMDGDVIGEISIDSIALKCKIYQGDNETLLKKGAGHSFFSMLPGEGDNIVVSAHRTTFFKKLGDVKPGDLIKIITEYGEYIYKMDSSVIFNPKDGEPIISGKSQETLTLYTCYPFIYRGHSPQRYAIICSLVSGDKVDWNS